MVLTPSSKINTNQSPVLGKPPRAGAANKDKQRVSFSPTRSPRNGGRRRRSSSHFTKKNKGKSLVDNNSDIESDDDESDIEFTLNGVNDIDGGDKHTIGGGNTTPTKKKKKPDKQQRRRRRSSARFLRLSSGGDDDANTNNGSPNSKNGDDENFTSSEHLGEIYRQAIRMNAENKINAGNSWGLKLIENMDKFIVEGSSGAGDGGDVSPRDSEDNARSELKAARKMKSKDDKGRVNFTKASCTLDASVKIYSYRVDDVHLSSYRVLANLNRTDTKGNKDDGLEGGVDLGDGEGGEKTVSKRRAGPKGPMETLESNKGTFNLFGFIFVCCVEITSLPIYIV